MKKLLLILLYLPMIGLGQNNLFVNILQNTVSICEGDTIDLIAIDSSFTASTGYNGPSWHVCQTGSDIHGDGSLTNPYFSIQTAVDSASSGDSIFVAPGTYYESIYIFDKDLFLLGSGIQQTIIDAQNQNYGIKMYGSNVPDTSIIHIEGFTIINAGNGQGQGAGIFLNGNSPSTNTFIYSTILTCEIVFCNYGIKYSNASGTSTIKNNISRNNVIGLKTWYSGIYYIENNTIVENRDGYSGSGYLKNNIIANNTEYGISSTVPVSSFNNIWGNGYGSYPPTSSVGDISVDPEFISATDFNLLSTSPCIDAGDPDTDGDGISWVTDTDDQDPDGTRIDMGALYYAQGPIVNVDSSIVIPSFNCLSYNWSSGQTQSTITVSPNQTTTYILTVSDGNSTSTDSVTVNVNPLPQPNLGPDILQYCNKDTSLSYYNITLNLNPGAGYSNYQWMSIIHDPYGMGGTWDNDTTFLGTDPTYTFSGNTGTITVFVTDSIGCVGSDSIVIQNIISGCTDTNNLVIGDTFGGGIIFYLDGAGSGLISSPIDQAGYGAAGAYWGCFYFDVPGADGTAIGTGAQNTVDIVNAGCGIAADLCANLTLGGYSDWFLPSKDELNEMYLNIGQGDIFDYDNIGGFGSNYHWSSSEVNSQGAYILHFNTGSILNHSKYYLTYVRAIREFTLPGYGCTDSTAFNYDPAATSDNGSCIAVTLGCTDSLAFNFDSLANTNDSSCIAFAYGCTDSTMFNYNASANTDDGTCFPFIYGCMDSTATNYNALANTDDGTCTFCYATADIGTDSITACDSTLISTNPITNGSYLWNTSNVSSSSNLAIGDTYQGGLIFYLDGNGGGLISAPSDQSTGAEWGCHGTSISTGTAIGTGAQNTIDILNGCTTSGIAAEICANLTLGGYSDWFLPSKDELSEMYYNIGPWSASDIAGFSNYFYWSSSEWSQFSSTQAWCLIYPSNPPEHTSAKYDMMFVRAIRAFSAADTTSSVMVSTSGWNYVTVTDSLGCTATDSVYVNINSPNTGTTSVTACDFYNWDGTVYTTSGSYSNTFTNVSGCDSVHTLNLTINYSTSSTDSQVHCDTYSWNSTVYTVSGTFTYLTTNAVGCDSIATLNLTINNSYPSSNNTTNYYICDGQSVTIVNSIYTNPGTYIDSLISINGCDSTVISIVHVSYLSLTSSSTPVTCSNWNDGSVAVSANAGMPPYTYQWSTGNSTAQVDQLPMGTYSVTVSDSACSITTSANINLNIAPADSMHPEICYVSVDNTGFNRVVLKPLENALTAQYVILREYSANLYAPLDTIDANTLEYLDSTSNPAAQAERYKVSAIDACGNSTDTSAYHKTVHLTMSLGVSGEVNLIWNSYEGYQVTDYLIYRGNSYSNMNMIGTISGTNSSFTDLTPPTGVLKYQIRAFAQNCASIPNAFMLPDTLESNIIDHTNTGTNTLTVSISSQNPTCPTCNDGYAVATASSGTAPYTYFWSTGSTMPFISALGVGAYTVYAFDADNNTATASVTLSASSTSISGCTDPTATNFDPLATIDDGTCTYTSVCSASAITGLFVSGIIDDRAVANFDNMNTYDASGAQICRVDQIRIRYREVGTTSWSQKNIASPTGYDATTGICNSTQKTDKNIYGLTLGTTYEWEVKLWYCSTGATSWAVGPNFTTAGECPNIGNFTAYGANPTKATFDWDASNGSYDFVRIKVRVDSISNPQVTDWFQVGGFGVTYGTFTENKNGLAAGETYRAQARTWCDPNGGAYNSLAWTALATWTQPTSIRLEGGTTIANLAIYPNPSRDKFNVSFTSEMIQDLKVRILNLIGEELINDKLEQFIGEYTKQIDLTNNAKGIYFLEIETNDGVINKKLILQ